MADKRTHAAGPTVHYIDGYHGGVEGHMPPGCMSDILAEIDKRPWWKISLEIEPFSWDVLRQRDPEAYERLREHVAQARRVEIVSGTYAQPFNWAISGESNIRQLLYGLAENRRHFPRAAIDTYAVQEPCFTSCLPQILRSLGYMRAALKNFTCWGGYMAGRHNASLVNWVGPDGSSLPAAPRYACEGPNAPWGMESTTPSPDFAQRCAAAGITHPAGTAFQDAGWPAHPAVDAQGRWMQDNTRDCQSAAWPHETPSHIRYTTWREFIDTIAPRPTIDWRVSQEDIRVALVWGAQGLQKLARAVRGAENRIIAAEKMAAMAAISGAAAWPAEALDAAWKDLLLAQHHDSWIVFFGGGGARRRESWAWQSNALSWNTERAANRIVAAGAAALSPVKRPSRGAQRPLHARVFNTLGRARKDIVEIPVVLPPGTQDVRVTDARGNPMVHQLCVSRRYGDGAVNAAVVLASIDTPAMGHTTVRIDPAAGPAPAAFEGAAAYQRDDGAVIVDTDHFRIVVDPARGGTVSSLVMRATGRELVDPDAPRLFNEYRGYFTDERQYLSSADTRAQATIAEAGPLRVRVDIKGTVGPLTFASSITADQGGPRIDCSVRLSAADNAHIGEPWDGANTHSAARRPCYDDRFKLLALFPCALPHTVVDKSAPFDVCRSALADTFFNSWDTIKNNVINGWVDAFDEKENAGIALFSDHTTAYAHGPDHPLGLVLGFSGMGLWGVDYQLREPIATRYALMPHAGAWYAAGLWAEYARFCEPLIPQICSGAPAGPAARSFIEVTEPGIELSAMRMQGRDLQFRLFNAGPRATDAAVVLGFKAARAALVTPDGAKIRDIALRATGRQRTLTVPMPPFGIRTVQVRTRA